jgi:ferric-chelate reductase
MVSYSFVVEAPGVVADFTELTGGTGHTVFNSFSSAVLIAGGSGITFVLSAVQDILRNVSDKQTNLRTVHVVWSVRGPGLLP